VKFKTTADRGIVAQYAKTAYNLLDNYPEFGAETRMAIRDTAGMIAADDGILLDEDVLRDVVAELA
jgi:hypothetical protein